jgi:hypothetical protein
MVEGHGKLSLDYCRRVLAKRREIHWTNDRVAVLIVAVWPFLFLWPYTLGLLTIGNDFDYAQYNYKAYLLVALASWHFPLWSPTELAGYPFFSNPFAQAVYPLNLLYLAFYAAVGRFSVWHYTLFTIMGISLFGIGLYRWLRRLVFPSYIALLASVIACASIKVTEIIRFPNAVHSAAWLPWLLLGVTMAAKRNDLFLGAITFGIATLMFLTAGYPYYVIYAPFLIGPYFAALLLAPVRRSLLHLPLKEQTGSIHLLVSIASAFAIAAAVAFPWLRHVMALLDQTRDRATANFDFATQHKFGLISTVGSWVFPPAASMEGWYYFGMPATLLIGTYFCCLPVRAFGFERHRAIALWIFGWFIVVTYFTWGADSALFRFVWHHVAVLDQMRVWPRLNIVLVPAIACLLAFAFSFFIGVVDNAREGWRRQTTLFVAIFATLCVAIMAVQAFLIWSEVRNEYWRDYFACRSCAWEGWRQLVFDHFDERFFGVMTVLAAIALIGAVGLARYLGSSNWPKTLAGAICILSVIDLWYISNAQWPYHRYNKFVGSETLTDVVNGSLSQPRKLTPNLADPTAHHDSVGLVDGWGFIRHGIFFSQYFRLDGSARPDVSQDQIMAATRFFGADQNAKRLFLSSRIDVASPHDFVADVDATAASGYTEIAVAFFDGDTLRVDIHNPAHGRWLSYVDNWDANWTAIVDGREVAIERLFGSYKSVRVPTGRSTVIFSYRPGLLPSEAR